MKILAYGTLRKGDFNFQRIEETYGSEAIKKVAEGQLSGYKMFDLGFFPAVCKGEPTDQIQVDVLEVNAQAAEFINTMELDAGYKVEEVSGGRLYVYGYNLTDSPQIHSGDWFNK